MSWLDELCDALEAAQSPVAFFVRDDDAGWRDDRLRRLLEVFDRYEAPVDLAVIPCAVGGTLARELRRRRAAAPTRTGLHQHGLAHANHEPAGRRCEFGPSRSPAVQRADIERGRRRLEALLELPLDPIFTPPWNRCTHATGRALVESGVRVLSRESRAEPLQVDGLAELPVHVDWFATHKGVRLPPAQIAGAIAAEARAGGPVGLMLHHAAMDAAERRRAAELLSLLTAHPSAQLVTMAELAG